MEPVLTHLNDNVLFLKHNLNAAAIGGLADDMEGIESRHRTADRRHAGLDQRGG